MSDVRFGSWAAAESPVTVEYSLAAIEEIRQEVAQGFQRFARGGIEVGGILYGELDGQELSVLAMRPIQCEHSRGPDFLLSDRDRELLEQQVRKELQDSRLEGMHCVGWFLSHNRSDIMLSDSDQEIYSKYFGEPWQVTLVVRPGRGGSMRAGFFVREHDGAVKSQSSYLEFNFPDPSTEVLDQNPPPERGPAERGPMERRTPAYVGGEAGAAIVSARRETSMSTSESTLGPTPGSRSGSIQAPAPETWEGPQLLPATRRRAKWPWLMGWLAVVTALAMVALQHFGVLVPRPEPISLTVEEHDGQLQIEWNHDAKPVTAAGQGSLAIVDGADVHTVALSPQDLARGSFFYYRNSGDVQVRLVLTSPKGKKLGEEASRFLGRGSMNVDPNELLELQRQRDESQAEVEQLKQRNEALAVRVQELERTLRIMQARMGAQ